MSDGSGLQKIDLDEVDWRGSREFFESLTAALEKLDDKDESYDFTWVGKRKAIIEAGAPINKTLRPNVGSSKNWDTTENLFIEGDNLDALKLLQESYLGKVKMIYIDPPYNTGKDFVYHDNFKASTEQYDEDTEYRDDEGNIQFKKNEKSNGRYHSDWLSMMYPRLKLSRNLLTDDGLIFISIGDDEQSNLKKLCDEIFGEDSFLAQFIWKRRQNVDSRPKNGASTDHEYIICYSRTQDGSIRGADKDRTKYSNPDNDPKGDWMSADMTGLATADQRPNLHYELTDPESGITYACPQTGWRYEKKRMAQLVANHEVIFPKSKDGRPRRKKYYADLTSDYTGFSTTLSAPYNTQGTREVRSLFDDADYFDFPKPTELIMTLINQGTVGKNDLVLDLFCGSGTTAHAVMNLNAKDGGARKHIQVQLAEPISESSAAYSHGYKSIADIARERIRRAGDKIASEYPDATVDYGFRALTIADTNYKDVFKPAGQLQQADLLSAVDNVKEDRTDLDLLYGVLTQSALELNRPISTTEISGATVYQYDYFGEVSGLIACFAKDVPEDAIKAIARLKPLTAVFRDSSFADSQAKVNLAEHFRILSPDTKVKVV